MEARGRQPARVDADASSTGAGPAAQPAEVLQLHHGDGRSASPPPQGTAVVSHHRVPQGGTGGGGRPARGASRRALTRGESATRAALSGMDAEARAAQGLPSTGSHRAFLKTFGSSYALRAAEKEFEMDPAVERHLVETHPASKLRALRAEVEAVEDWFPRAPPRRRAAGIKGGAFEPGGAPVNYLARRPGGLMADRAAFELDVTRMFEMHGQATHHGDGEEGAGVGVSYGDGGDDGGAQVLTLASPKASRPGTAASSLSSRHGGGALASTQGSRPGTGTSMSRPGSRSSLRRNGSNRSVGSRASTASRPRTAGTKGQRRLRTPVFVPASARGGVGRTATVSEGHFSHMSHHHDFFHRERTANAGQNPFFNSTPQLRPTSAPMNRRNDVNERRAVSVESLARAYVLPPRPASTERCCATVREQAREREGRGTQFSTWEREYLRPASADLLRRAQRRSSRDTEAARSLPGRTWVPRHGDPRLRKGTVYTTKGRRRVWQKLDSSRAQRTRAKRPDEHLLVTQREPDIEVRYGAALTRKWRTPTGYRPPVMSIDVSFDQMGSSAVTTSPTGSNGDNFEATGEPAAVDEQQQSPQRSADEPPTPGPATDDDWADGDVVVVHHGDSDGEERDEMRPLPSDGPASPHSRPGSRASMRKSVSFSSDGGTG